MLTQIKYFGAIFIVIAFFSSLITCPQQISFYPYGLYTTDSEFISTQLGFSITLTTQAEPAVLRRSDPGCLRLMGRYSVDDCAPEELLELIQI